MRPITQHGELRGQRNHNVLRDGARTSRIRTAHLFPKVSNHTFVRPMILKLKWIVGPDVKRQCSKFHDASTLNKKIGAEFVLLHTYTL